MEQKQCNPGEDGVDVRENLEFVTFTGVDVNTEPQELSTLYAVYPRLEFGFLVGSHSGEEGYNRYPPIETVKTWGQLFQESGRRSAIHLCGKYSRRVMRGELEPVLELCDGFGRVQINARSEDYNYEQIARFAENFSGDCVILQKRETSDSQPLKHPRVEYLFDCSGGRGLDNFNSWPKPEDDQTRQGYAGGLGPDNIDRALSFVDANPNSRLWLDMESGVRDELDWLDVDKINQVCRAAFQPNSLWSK